MKTEYLDLMLLHQPFADYYGAYRALEDLYTEGVIRAIGVSNFYPDRLVDIANFARIVPMVNQVETHPLNQQTEAMKWMKKKNMMCRLRHGHLSVKAEVVCLKMMYWLPSEKNTIKLLLRLCFAGICSVEW